MDVDLAGPDDAAAVVVLLHPHPHYGGDRFHPLVDQLFRRLPESGAAAARFDLTSGDVAVARDELIAAMDAAARRWPDVAILLVGYSFGAGVAANVDDERVAGWFLVAPQSGHLRTSSLGRDARPTRVLVPAHDQFSPPADVEAAAEGWPATTVEAVPGDHFLAGSLPEIVDRCLAWVRDSTSA